MTLIDPAGNVIESCDVPAGDHNVAFKRDTGWFGKRDGRWFFFVPQDCEQFAIPFGGPPTSGRDPMTVEIIHPDDRTAQRIADLERAEQRVITIEPRPDERGRVWSLNDGARIIDVKGIARWFANSLRGAIVGDTN